MGPVSLENLHLGTRDRNGIHRHLIIGMGSGWGCGMLRRERPPRVLSLRTEDAFLKVQNGILEEETGQKEKRRWQRQ